MGSNHLPIVIELYGGKPANSPQRKATYSYKKADFHCSTKHFTRLYRTGMQTLPLLPQRLTLFSQRRFSKLQRRPIPKALVRLSAFGGPPEVEDAVTLRRQTQEALKADPDDDAKATAYQEAKANLFCKEYTLLSVVLRKTKLLMLTLNLMLEVLCHLRVLAQVQMTRITLALISQVENSSELCLDFQPDPQQAQMRSQTPC